MLNLAVNESFFDVALTVFAFVRAGYADAVESLLLKTRKEVKGMPRKKKNRVPKNGPVWHRTAEQATLDQMPKYNAYACGTGAHGDAKYNRAKQKRAWQREMDQQGARNRERLSFLACSA